MRDEVHIPLEKARRQAGRRGPPPRSEQFFCSYLDFVDIEPRLEARAIVKGLLGEGAMSVVYGDSNTGKTFFVLDLALHVALGWPWRERKVQGRGVLYLALEGAHSISNRVAAFKSHHRLRDEEPPFVILPLGLDLRSPAADTDAIITFIRNFNEIHCPPGDEDRWSIGLIIVDTLSRALAGGNENAPDDMGAFVMNLDRIRQATGAHVMVVHHTGKEQERGARGHSLLRAATDTEIEIARDATTGISTATVRKQRDLAIDPEPLAFTLKGVTLGVDQDGDVVTSAVTIPADSSAPARRVTIPDRHKLALDQLHNCLVDHGEPAPVSKYFPAGATVVKADLWRDYVRRAGIISDDYGNPREAWRRIKKELHRRGYIGEWDGLVWSVQRRRGVTTPFVTPSGEASQNAAPDCDSTETEEICGSQAVASQPSQGVTMDCDGPRCGGVTGVTQPYGGVTL